MAKCMINSFVWELQLHDVMNDGDITSARGAWITVLTGV
jgi:hypothetical protein